jgi:uncharacterized protein with HEPN domain
MRPEQAKFQWAVHEALHYAERALAHIGDMSPDEFAKDLKTFDAVTRCIEVIGEAGVRAKKASLEIYGSHPELMFDNLREARNEAIHEYERVDPKSLYLTIFDTVKPLADACRNFLGTSKEARITDLIFKMHDLAWSVPHGFADTLAAYVDEDLAETLNRAVYEAADLKSLLEAHSIIIPRFDP